MAASVWTRALHFFLAALERLSVFRECVHGTMRKRWKYPEGLWANLAGLERLVVAALRSPYNNSVGYIAASEGFKRLYLYFIVVLYILPDKVSFRLFTS